MMALMATRQLGFYHSYWVAPFIPSEQLEQLQPKQATVCATNPVNMSLPNGNFVCAQELVLPMGLKQNRIHLAYVGWSAGRRTKSEVVPVVQQIPIRELAMQKCLIS